MRAIIVGAGLTGLATAIGLAQAGWEVVVLEQAPELKEIGAGIQIPVNSSRALERLGVLSAIEQRAVRPAKIALLRYQDGAALSVLELDPWTAKHYGRPWLVIHRADFARILHDAAVAAGATVRFGCEVASARLADATVELVGGGMVAGDMLVGADGERSMIRAALQGSPSPLRPNGRWVYRVLVPLARIPAAMRATSALLGDAPRVGVYAGSGCHAVTYVLADHVNFVLFTPADATAAAAAAGSGDTTVASGPEPIELSFVLHLLRGWDAPLRQIVALGRSCLRWSLMELQELDAWVHPAGRSVIIGDAAHACLPFLAQGAAIGVEGAVLLSALLSKAERTSQIADRLRLFNRAHRARARAVGRKSREMGAMLELEDGRAQEERDRSLREDGASAGCAFAYSDPVFRDWLFRYDPVETATELLAGGHD